MKKQGEKEFFFQVFLSCWNLSSISKAFVDKIDLLTLNIHLFIETASFCTVNFLQQESFLCSLNKVRWVTKTRSKLSPYLPTEVTSSKTEWIQAFFCCVVSYYPCVKVGLRESSFCWEICVKCECWGKFVCRVKLQRGVKSGKMNKPAKLFSKIFSSRRESNAPKVVNISRPADVKQEMHVEVDPESGALIGLPPQWENMMRQVLT